MPHDTGASVGKLQILHRGKKRLDFDLHGLRQKLPRTSTQNIGQWIVDLVGLTKGNNLASLVHGVSLSLRGSGRLDTRLDTPPISFRHHPLSRIAHPEKRTLPRRLWAHYRTHAPQQKVFAVGTRVTSHPPGRGRRSPASRSHRT